LRLTSDVCAFPQRFTRPAFLHKTKHAKRDFEDVAYSYVVIRRGERPFKPLSDKTERPEETAPTGYADHVDGEPGEPLSKLSRLEYSMESERQKSERIFREQEANQEELERLRQESYHWRRIIYNPMKGSGHITMDTCTPRGELLHKGGIFTERNSSSVRRDSAYSDPKVARKTGVLRCTEVGLG
jgi:ribosomal protein RSM22 (predicted rRNA methylase)